MFAERSTKPVKWLQAGCAGGCMHGPGGSRERRGGEGGEVWEVRVRA